MERHEEIGERDPQDLRDDAHTNAQRQDASRELDLTEAEQLIERLHVVDRLTPSDVEELRVMMDELTAHKEALRSQDAPIPETLVYLLGELSVLFHGAVRSVREEYEHRDAVPDSLTRLLAEAGALELELVEREAAHTLPHDPKPFHKKVTDMLNRLDAMILKEDHEARIVLESQRNTLRRFLRVLDE